MNEQQKATISAMITELKRQADEDGNLHLLSDRSMYLHWKHNADYEEEFANAYIRKYFKAKMQIKLMYFWYTKKELLNEHDKEMLYWFGSWNPEGKILNKRPFAKADKIWQIAQESDPQYPSNLFLCLHYFYCVRGKEKYVNYFINRWNMLPQV